MIDWQGTKSQFNYGREIIKAKSRFRVAVHCDGCGVGYTSTVRKRSLLDQNCQMSHLCPKCRTNNKEYREARSKESKELWAQKRDKILRKTRSDSFRANMSQLLKEKWQNIEYRSSVIESNITSHNTDAYRERASEITSILWQDDNYRDNIVGAWTYDKRKQASLRSRELFYNHPEYRERLSERAKKLHAEGKLRDARNTEEAHRKSAASYKQRYAQDPELRAKMSSIAAGKWDDTEFRDRVTQSMQLISDRLNESSATYWSDPDNRDKAAARSRALWNDPDYKAKMDLIWSDPEFIERMRAVWDSPEYRKKMSDISRKLWQDPEYRAKMEAIFRSDEYLECMSILLAQQPRVSSLQTMLYSMLDDLDVTYYREYEDGPNDPETVIGPYNFDCVVPVGDKKLLIECQGDYWHARDKAIRVDKAKATYIEKYHPDCEIKYLWEHEFLCMEKVIELIKYWLGINDIDIIDFEFNDVEIKTCKAGDYRLLLSKYHYLPSAGRGGIAYGAYLGDELIAVCVFSPLVRQNLPWDNKTSRELSRLCIHPRYQKKNFASWFVSRCMNQLDPQYRTIISYCDTTFNHDGATYRACNFRHDGDVPADYWYVAEDGWVMHKKTLYGHAKKMGMTESEFAELHGYKKIYGKKKLRFVYER